MNTATFVKNLSDNFQGDARLYKLSTPLLQEKFDWEEDKTKTRGFNYVVVSAVNAMFTGPETYIFGADKSGKVLDWSELPGSFRGSRDHLKALNDAGYDIVE